MIVLSTKQFLGVNPNIYQLSKGDYYFYVHRSIYDQALVLAHTKQIEDLMVELDRETNREAISWFKENTPYPLYMLAPFLGLVNYELESSPEKYCGALQVMLPQIGGAVNFLKFDENVRKDIQYTISVQEEYQNIWDMFFMSAIEYDEFLELRRIQLTGVVSYKPTVESSYGKSSTEDELEETIEELKEKHGELEENEVYFIEEPLSKEVEDFDMEAFLAGDIGANNEIDTSFSNSSSSSIYTEQEKEKYGNVLILS